MFYVMRKDTWNFQRKKGFWKSFILKKWPLICLKLALAKLKQFKYFEP